MPQVTATVNIKVFSDRDEFESVVARCDRCTYWTPLDSTRAWGECTWGGYPKVKIGDTVTNRCFGCSVFEKRNT